MQTFAEISIFFRFFFGRVKPFDLICSEIDFLFKTIHCMILIADSGSTKTEWCLVENRKVYKSLYTKGINPFYQNENEIKSDLENNLYPELKGETIDAIYFYGAGCSFPDKKAMVSNAIGSLFRHVTIEVYSDLLAAARSLLGHGKGIACILGTGSNSCYYDGREIVKNVSPLGFILGDEGSGAVLSKTFVADSLKNQIDPELSERFMKKYDITPAFLLENIYKKSFPNRFLASFTPFLAENIQHPDVYNIVYSGFVSFFKRNVMQYETENMKIRFTGSVAHSFADVLKKAADDCGLKVDKVEKCPMAGLIDFHFS